MKKVIIVFVLLLAAEAVYTQDKAGNEIAQQIDAQVWEPFKEAYGSKDAKKYNSLHTDDVLRVTKSGIRKGTAYKNSIVRSFSRKDRPERTIDFRFEHRIHSDSIAYEVGYYKVAYTQAGSESSTSYGRFHVVLKKIGGIWKIAQDWDTDVVNGLKVTSEDFLKLQ